MAISTSFSKTLVCPPHNPIYFIFQKRINSRRNGIVPCYKHKEPTKNGEIENGQKRGQKCSAGLLDRTFSRFSKILMKSTAKISILILTTGILGVSVWGNIELRQEFDPMWFLPKESYLSQWYHYYEK